MKRRALIIYCDSTISGELFGPWFDNIHYVNFLTSNLGGRWDESEVLSLQNPTTSTISKAVNKFLAGVDYTFIIFTGHGFINSDENNRQYLEVSDGDISILKLRTNAKRQTLIVDACRGFHSPTEAMLKGFSETYEHFMGDPYSTRKLFDRAVLRAEEGWTILYAASQNQTALDTDDGAAYLLSLLHIAKTWGKLDKKNNILDVRVAHNYAKTYLRENFETIQVPSMNKEKRLNYFPLAVKMTLIKG